MGRKKLAQVREVASERGWLAPELTLPEDGVLSPLVRNHGYTGSYSSMYRFLGQLVSLQQPDVPLRLTFKSAEAVQVDFGAGPRIIDVYTGEIFKTWFFVMTLCWSRHLYAEFIRDQTVATWLGGHRGWRLHIEALC